MEKLLSDVAAFSRVCKSCGVMLFFIQHYGSEKLTPYTKEGINHFWNCPDAGQFRKGKAKAHA